MSERKGGNYFYAIIGIALVLLVVGIGGILGIEARRMAIDMKENFTLELVLSDTIQAPNIATLESAIKGREYVKLIKFISKDEALELLKKSEGDADVELLGFNPLYNSFLVNLYEKYANTDSIEEVRKNLLSFGGVEQVNFKRDVLQTFNRGTSKIWLAMLVVAALLLVFAVSLIFNTIRLAMFSNRFIIKTMQLFGATRWFIIRPILGRSLFNGLISGMIACMLLTALIWYFDYTEPELALHRDLITFALLYVALIVFGIIISFFSTLTAVLRYLRLKVEDLY